MDSYVYDVGTIAQAQLFADTTREIAEYAGRTLKEAHDITMAIKDLEEFILTKSTKAVSTDATEIKVEYTIEMEHYYKRRISYR